MDAQINDQVIAMFRAAGFTGVTTMRGNNTVTISAAKGDTRAVFHAATTAAPAAAIGGGRYTDTPELQAAIVPNYQSLRQALLDNPALATATGLAADQMDIVRRLPDIT
jgi:hypothetical protein